MNIRQLLSKKPLLITLAVVVFLLVAGAVLLFGPVGRYAYASARCEESPAAAQDALSTVPDTYRDTATLRRYVDALFYRKKDQYDEAIALFTELDYYRNSRIYVRELTYKKAEILREAGDYDGAVALFESSLHEDWETQVRRTVYEKASSLEQSGQYTEAAKVYQSLDRFEDSVLRRLTCLTAHAQELCDQGDLSAAAKQMDTVLTEDEDDRFQSTAADIYFAYAEQLIAEENWAEAITRLELCDGYPDANAVEEKMTYCSSMLTYLAAIDMMNAGDFAGAVDLFDTIPGFLDADEYNASCEQIAYTWSFKGWLSKDGTTDTQTTTFRRSDTIYFYGTLTGGKPGRTIDLRFVWVDVMGATAETLVADWTDGTSGGVTFSYSVPKNANVGKSTIYVYNDETDEQIAKYTFTVRE